MLNDILDIELNKRVKINFTCVSLFSYQTTGGKINSHEWLSQVSPLTGVSVGSAFWRTPRSQSARAGLRHSWGGLTLSRAQDQRAFLFAFLNSVFSAPWRARGCDVTV